MKRNTNHRFEPGIPEKAFFLLIFLCLAAVFSGSAQELVVLPSKYLKCDDSVLVYSPRGESKPAPALFLLHGWSGNFRNWGDKCDLQRLSDSTGFRIICPDGFYNSWYLNNTDPRQMQWRTFFDRELYPHLQQKYGLVPDSTFITGLSMGGHGAINLYIDRPERFRTAGSMSGVLDLQLTSLRESQISKVVGKETVRYDTESAVHRLGELEERLSRMKDRKREPLVISCGYDDVYVICTERFAEACRRQRIPFIQILSPGTHSWTYWTFALGQHLQLFRRMLDGKNLGY